jgi:nucleoside-diphosphate-sugar epimerase
MLGYHVVRALLQDPLNQVTVAVRDPDNPLLADLPVRKVRVDFGDLSQLRQVVRSARPDAVIHAAASGLRNPKPNWFETARFNVDVTLRLFEATCELVDCHFVHISSGMVYKENGRPLLESDPLDTLHPYAASKAGGDILIRAAAIEFKRRLTVLRPFSFTGLHDATGHLFPSLLSAACHRRPCEMTSGTQIRDFCAVEDVADGVVRSLDFASETPLEVINLGSGAALSVRQLVENVCEELELPVELQWGAKHHHPFEPQHLVADVQRARRLLGWQATTSLAFAVWQLAKAAFPNLRTKAPKQQR